MLDRYYNDGRPFYQKIEVLVPARNLTARALETHIMQKREQNMFYNNLSREDDLTTEGVTDMVNNQGRLYELLKEKKRRSILTKHNKEITASPVAQ